MSRSFLPLVVASATLLAACGDSSRTTARRDSIDQQAHIREVVAAGGTVDSVLPVAVALDRFRTDLPEVRTLSDASDSRDQLVARLANAIARRDTTALAALVLTRAEFAWLFYESSAMSKPPYEAPPGLLWGQIEVSSEEGVRRLLDRLGGQPVQVSALQCPDAPVTEGANTLYTRCTVRLTGRDGMTLEGNLFGTILKRDGKFKFVGLGNRI